MGHCLRVYVHDAFAVVVDGEPAVAGHLANHGCFHVPLVDDVHEGINLVGSHNCHHAFLRFRHQDLACSQGGVAQKHIFEVDVHTRVAV